MASYTEFMGYTQPWYSVRDVDEPIGGEMGHVSCFLRDGDRVFLTYSTTGRGNEAASGSFALLDMTPYGRGEAWQASPEGWPEGHDPCWYWRSDAAGNATWGPTSRPVPQWTRPGATPVGDPRPARPPPLTRLRSVQLSANKLVIEHTPLSWLSPASTRVLLSPSGVAPALLGYLPDPSGTGVRVGSIRAERAEVSGA